jgi:hypothetical protein
MSDENEKNDLYDIISGVINTKFPVYHVRIAKVKKITQEAVDEVPGLLTVEIEEADFYSIRWQYPIKPMLGSLCIVMFLNNKPSQGYAISFSQIEKIKTKIDETLDIEISKEKAILQFESTKLELLPDKIKLTGDIEHDGDFITTGELKADKEISAMNATPSTKVTVSKHQHGGPTATPISGL